MRNHIFIQKSSQCCVLPDMNNSLFPIVNAVQLRRNSLHVSSFKTWVHAIALQMNECHQSTFSFLIWGLSKILWHYSYILNLVRNKKRFCNDSTKIGHKFDELRLSKMTKIKNDHNESSSYRGWCKIIRTVLIFLRLYWFISIKNDYIWLVISQIVILNYFLVRLRNPCSSAFIILVFKWSNILISNLAMIS